MQYNQHNQANKIKGNKKSLQVRMIINKELNLMSQQH